MRKVLKCRREETRVQRIPTHCGWKYKLVPFFEEELINISQESKICSYPM